MSNQITADLSVDQFVVLEQALLERFRSCQTEIDQATQKIIFHDFLKELDILLEPRTYNRDRLALTTVYWWISARLFTKEILEWVSDVIKTPGAENRSGLRIGFLERIPEEPVDLLLLDFLFGFLLAESTQWVVCAAYWQFPQYFYDDFRAFLEGNGIDLPVPFVGRIYQRSSIRYISKEGT